ncbi:MAG: translation initiation factor IF-2 [Deltaproteobacteria bacterium]|nr:translation initiation factor IF-2 [Deltaproteobacteria bacterium]
MSKIRVRELAKELGVENKELIDRCKELGFGDKGPSHGLENSEVDKLRKAFKPREEALPEDKQVVVEKKVTLDDREMSVEERRVKSTVIRRRTKEVEVKPQVVEPPKPVIVEMAPEAEVTAPVEAAPVPEIPPAPVAEEEKPKEEVKGKKKDKALKKAELLERKERVFKPVPTFRGKKRGARVALPAGAKKTEITVPKAIKRVIKISDVIQVAELAKRMGIKAGEVIKKLFSLGIMATINQAVDIDAASLVAHDFGYEVERVGMEVVEEMLEETPEVPEKMVLRPPVVTVMGHVDHGKTSLLDAIRQTDVAAGEAGGITQHIGAHHVKLERGDLVFLDTPGHEAFTAMRARGAQVTDFVILVVAADDGVMPQTVEALNHAKAAGVPIIVAVNKIDKPGANPDKVKQALSDHGLLAEDWGGDTIFVNVSAKQRTGIKELLEMIILQAEVMELKANPDKLAKGTIIEAKLDKGRGPVATVLVEEGTLKVGDPFVAGVHFGRIRAMIDDKGAKVEKAGPSMPVEVQGLPGVPLAGEKFIVVSDEKKAREIGTYRQMKLRETELSKSSKVSLEDLYNKIKEGEVKELGIIIKADVHGSVEALAESLQKLSTEAIKLKVLHGSVGAITETDVLLAAASNAIIIGFHVRPDAKVHSLAEQEGVDIRLYNIIYEVIDDVKKAMEGLLTPTLKEVVLGRAEIREVFSVPKIGNIGGCFITDGKITRVARVRLIRDGIVLHDGKMASLRRFKDDVKEVQSGYECGIGIENYNDIKTGDVIEAYIQEKVAAKL